MQLTGYGQAIFEASENHVENDTEGTMETPYWIRKGMRVLFDSSRDPRVGQLKKKRSTSAEEDRSLAVYAPDG